jgi:putative ABC transport system permease protein
VTDDFFAVMDVPALVGRTFSDAEWRAAQFNSAAAPAGPDPVVILSHAVWRQYFGGDTGIIGRTITLERRSFVVVGVMPEHFAMPDPDVQLWIPWDVSGDRPRDQRYLGAVARLAPGYSIDQADAQLNAVAADLALEYPEANRGWGVALSGLRGETIGDAAALLWLLLGAVGLGLFVACANVALLSLMRGMDRAHETAVRLALGASAARVLAAFLLESALLAAAGGILGIAVAFAGVALLPQMTTVLPRLHEVTVDSPALLFILGVTCLSALLSGLPQAWRRTRGAPRAAAALGVRGSTDGGRRHALRDLIVVGQVAIAFVLIAASGLLTRSVLQLRGTDTGFDPAGVLVAPVFLDTEAYSTGDQTRDYYARLFERLAALPGVTAVGGATTVPTSPLGPDFDRPVWPEGTAAGSPRRIPASIRMVTPGYLEALRIRLADGRAFDARDQPGSPRVVMVNETLARRLWPDESAVNRQLVVDYSTSGTYPYEIVGVVGDVRFRGPRSEPVPEVYFPHAQRSYLILNVVVRADGDARALVPAVRDALRAIDPQKPAHGVHPLEDLLGATYARDRQTMVALVVFAGAAILLAVLGVYGVLSQRVRERSREIGIRMAMGADSVRVVAWVARAGFRLIALGAVLGLLMARGIGGVLDGLLFGVSKTDGVTAIAAVAVLVFVGLVATLLPSWRATRIDPVTILRRG